MKNLLTGALIGAVVAAVIGGTVWSATSLMYLSGTAPTVGHVLTAADTTGGVQDGGASTKVYQLTWGPAQNLSTAVLPMGIAVAAAPVVSASCALGALVGGVATVDLYYAASATALGSGTKITTGASCNANLTANSTQSGLAGAGLTIPAGNYFGVVATGAGWPGTGSGAIQLTLQQ